MDLSTGFTGKGYEGSQVTEKSYDHSDIMQHRIYDSCRSDVHSILLIRLLRNCRSCQYVVAIILP